MANVNKKKTGHIFDAPLDVRLDEYNVVQPDLIYISEKNKHIITEKNIQGAPDLMMEILSPSSFHHDQERKKAVYERFGVLEYWIIDPANQVIEIFSLSTNKKVLPDNVCRNCNFGLRGQECPLSYPARLICLHLIVLCQIKYRG